VVVEAWLDETIGQGVDQEVIKKDLWRLDDYGEK
jgi:hypothetical protein